VAVSCGVGHRHGLDLALLWLWCRPAAVAPIRPLAWEPPYAMGVALKKEREPSSVWRRRTEASRCRFPRGKDRDDRCSDRFEHVEYCRKRYFMKMWEK